MSKRKYKNINLKTLNAYESKKALYLFAKPYKIYNDGRHYVASLSTYSNKKYCNNTILDIEKTRYFDNIYFDALNMNLHYNDLIAYLKQNMIARFPEIENIDEYIQKRLKQSKHNFYNRVKRFKRKANLNYWNYFVTITYDDKKHDKTSFRNKLRKCLSNLHTRYGWKYMGVFELSPTKERLHFTL